MWFSTEEHLPIHRRLFAFVRYSLPRNVSVESVLKSGCPLHSTATLVFFRCCFGFSRVGRPCYISVTNFHEFSSSPQILSWPQYITIVPVRDAQRGRIREPAKRWEATMKSGSGRRCLEPSSLWQKFGWRRETDMTWYDRHKTWQDVRQFLLQGELQRMSEKLSKADPALKMRRSSGSAFFFWDRTCAMPAPQSAFWSQALLWHLLTPLLEVWINLASSENNTIYDLINQEIVFEVHSLSHLQACSLIALNELLCCFCWKIQPTIPRRILSDLSCCFADTRLLGCLPQHGLHVGAHLHSFHMPGPPKIYSMKHNNIQ